MIDEHRAPFEPDAIESLIWSAGRYVVPSEDLRPRALEIARAERRERRVQQRLAQMAAMVLFMVTAITVYRQPLNEARDGAFLPVVESLSTQADYGAARSVDQTSWETVESFTDLRRRQAQLLRL